MNHIYRSIWNDKTGTFVAVSENASSAGKKISLVHGAPALAARFALKALAASLLMAFGASVYAAAHRRRGVGRQREHRAAAPAA